MSFLDDAVEKLTRIAGHPCPCSPCVWKKRLAIDALKGIAPSGYALMNRIERDPDCRDTEGFKISEGIFRAEEQHRLLKELSWIERRGSECKLQTTPAAGPPTPPPTWKVFCSDPPNERVRNYMQRYRQAKIEMLKNPKIPGTYVIK